MRFGRSGMTRSTVRWSMDVPPKTDISCFGVFLRERGQNRVPEPPARITAYMLSSLCGSRFTGPSGVQELHRYLKDLSADLALKGSYIVQPLMGLERGYLLLEYETKGAGEGIGGGVRLPEYFVFLDRLV